MKHQSKLSQNQQNVEHQIPLQQNQQQAGQEFANADELLRFDAARTIVPAQIAQRLKQSSGDLPPAPRRSWWRNLLGQ